MSAPGPPDSPLAGRVAVVTGGATGLGRAIALGLAADGAAVARVDIEHALAHLGEQRARDRVAQRQLVARLGEVGDVVEAVRFLVSDRASFITGETLRVNGGGELFV